MSKVLNTLLFTDLSTYVRHIPNGKKNPMKLKSNSKKQVLFTDGKSIYVNKVCDEVKGIKPH